MSDPRLRKFKIATGSVKRLGKERDYNHKEVANQQKRIDTFKEQGKDEYDIRKQEEVLEEAKMMIPDTQRRLETARNDLSAMVESEKDLADSAEYKAAVAILAEVPLADPNA